MEQQQGAASVAGLKNVDETPSGDSPTLTLLIPRCPDGYRQGMSPKVPVAITVLAATLAAALAVFALRPGQGPAEPYVPPLNQARQDSGELVRHKCQSHGQRVRPLVCFYGPGNSTKRVVLFGDSHALQWGPALIPLAKKRGWRLVTVLRAGCTIADVVAERSCVNWRHRALREIERLQPQHLIIATSIGNRYRLKHQGRNLTRKASEPYLRRGMIKTIKRLKRIDSLVKGPTAINLIRDQIVAPFVPADCLRKNRDRPGKCDFRKRRKFGPGFDLVAARQTGIEPTIDPSKALCGPKWCTPTEGRILKYRDSDHITATYARTLSGWFDRRLGID